MIASFAFLLVILLSGKPTDLVSFLEPKSALEALGEPTDDAGLKRLIEGKAASAPASGAALDEKAVRTAVENLASSNESVRAKARDDLAALGEAARPRLEEIVKNDAKRAAEAKAVIDALDAAARVAASRSGVSRLLAVRLAGDRKIAALAEPVRAIASSPDPFLRQAAAETLARIEGKDPPPSPDRPWVKSLAALEALPEGTNYLVDLPAGTAFAALAGTPAPRIDQVLASMAGMMGFGDGGFLGEVTRGLLDFVVKCGNARVDRVSLANVGLMAKKSGIAVILSGEYESRLLESGIRSFGSWEVKEVGGKKVLASPFLRIVLLDDHHVILLFENASENFPLADYLSAHAASSKPLLKQARWAKFLGTLGSSARALILMRASLVPPDGFAGLEREGLGPDVVAAIKGWKELEAEAKAVGPKKLTYRLEAEFDEAKHANDLSAYVKGKIDEQVAELERMAGQAAGTPAGGLLKSALDVLKSIQVAGEGKKGTLRGELDPSMLLPLLMGTSMRTVDAPQAPEKP